MGGTRAICVLYYIGLQIFTISAFGWCTCIGCRVTALLQGWSVFYDRFFKQRPHLLWEALTLAFLIKFGL